MMVENKQLALVVCGCKNFKERYDCQFFQKWRNGECRFMEEGQGLWHELTLCTHANSLELVERAENTPVAVSSPNDYPHEVGKRNENILSNHGLTAGSQGVKVYPATHTWIFRLNGLPGWEGAPDVDFYCRKNKWRNAKTREMFYGDADALIRYMKSGGKQGANRDPNAPERNGEDAVQLTFGF